MPWLHKFFFRGRCGTKPPLCVNCKHHRLVDDTYHGCQSPHLTVDDVTGDIPYTSCDRIRWDSCYCGYLGKWFTLKDLSLRS